MSTPQQKPEYLGDPTLARVMRRPQWILALLFALVVAGSFAWLGQWQLSNAVRTDADHTVNTEVMRPLAEIAKTGTGVTDAGAGVLTEARGAFVRGDTRVVAPRDNDGVSGVWVVGHFVTEGPESEAGAHLAVAIGWAPDTDSAKRVLTSLDEDPAFVQSRRIEGRYMPPDGAEIPDRNEDPHSIKTMLPAHLANVWTDVDGPVYAGYVVLHAAAVAPLLDDLDPIDSVAPLPAEAVNWLNVFYAIEWVVFAGFAVFFWFRLTRDAWEKEHEFKLLEASGARDAGATGHSDDSGRPDDTQ